MTALHIACRNGHCDVVIALMKRNEVEVKSHRVVKRQLKKVDGQSRQMSTNKAVIGRKKLRKCVTDIRILIES